MSTLQKLYDAKERFFQVLPENVRLERIWFIAKTDFKKRYYGSFLGLLWALFNPILQMAVYYTVFTIVFDSREPYFPLFLFCGLIHFLFFVETATKAMNMFNSKRYLLENIQISAMDVYYANIMAGFMGFLFNFAIFFLFRLLIIPEMPGRSILLYPIVLFNLMIFTHGIALILSVIWVYFRDITHLWNIFRLALMWLSGVFFTISLVPGSATRIFGFLTPMSGILIHSRYLLMYNRPIYWDLFAYDFLYAIIVWGIGVFAFRRYGSRALEKL